MGKEFSYIVHISLSHKVVCEFCRGVVQEGDTKVGNGARWYRDGAHGQIHGHHSPSSPPLTYLFCLGLVFWLESGLLYHC